MKAGHKGRKTKKENRKEGGKRIKEGEEKINKNEGHTGRKTKKERGKERNKDAKKKRNKQRGETIKETLSKLPAEKI